MNDTPPDAETIIREEMEKTAALVSGARRLMAEGRCVDLSALEERIKTIVKALHAAPRDVASGYQTHVEVLLEILDVLESDLTEQFCTLENALKALQHRKAMDAYGAKDGGAKDDIE